MSSVPPPVLAALVAARARLARAGVPFVVAGSAGRALLGAPVRPRDLDLEVPEDGAEAAAAALGVRLCLETGGGVASRRGGRRLAGVALDLTAGLVVTGPAGVLPADFAAQHAAARDLVVAGANVRAAPPEEALARALVAGDWTRLARLVAEAAAGAPPADLAYLARRLSAAASAAR